jgi:hypothetical protein
LERLKRLCIGRDYPDAEACAYFDKMTKNGEQMGAFQKLLGAAIGSVAGRRQERSVESLFTPGGTHASKSDFAGMNDFEVISYLVILRRIPSDRRGPGSET